MNEFLHMIFADTFTDLMDQIKALKGALLWEESERVQRSWYQ